MTTNETPQPPRLRGRRNNADTANHAPRQSMQMPARMGIVACLAVLVSAVALAGENYTTTFTPKANQAYSEDINVWVYTADFAERFGMPDKWVSDKLEGAYAAAYRVETRSNRTFFPHKGPNVSMPIRECVLDLFLPSDADIPWATDQRAGTRFETPKAPAYLDPDRSRDERWGDQAFGVSGFAIVRYSKAGFEGLGHIKTFRKKLYPRIDYLSFNMTCTTPGDGASEIEFRPGGTSRNNEDAVTHRVHLPKRFMRDLYAEWKERSRDASEGEWKEVIQGE